MKNIVLTTSFAFLAALILFSLLGCSSDKKKSDTISIDGLWRVSHQKLYISENTTTADLKDTDNDENGDELDWIAIDYDKHHPIQNYLRFENGNYTELTVVTKDGATNETVTGSGTYSLYKTDLLITINQQTYTSEINFSQNTLYVYFENHPWIIENQLVRANYTPDDGDDNGNGDDNGGDIGDSDNDDDQDAPAGCATRHQRDAKAGSFMNPKLIDVGKTYDGILPDDTQNGFLYRYYLEVTPYHQYKIAITEISADYDEDIYELYHYLEVAVTEEFVSEFILQETKISKGQTTGQMLVDPATECLYINLFSYQENIEFKITVTEIE